MKTCPVAGITPQTSTDWFLLARNLLCLLFPPSRNKRLGEQAELQSAARQGKGSFPSI